jgi:hypothetical protein
MEPTQSSETSAFNIQTPGKYPEDYFSLLQHGESLKTRIKLNHLRHLIAKPTKSINEVVKTPYSGKYAYLKSAVK